MDEAGEERGYQEDYDIGYLRLEIGDDRFRNDGHKDDDGSDPEIEGEDGEFLGQRKLTGGSTSRTRRTSKTSFSIISVIADPEEPCSKERSEEKRRYARKNQKKGR